MQTDQNLANLAKLVFDVRPTRTQVNGPQKGTIVSATADSCYVSVAALNTVMKYGPCPYPHDSPTDWSVPPAGTGCLVMFASTGISNPWVLAIDWSGVTTSNVITTLQDDIAAPLTANPAGRVYNGGTGGLSADSNIFATTTEDFLYGNVTLGESGLIIATPGAYRVTAQAQVAFSTTGSTIQAEIYRNGILARAGASYAPVAGVLTGGASVTSTIKCAAGDYFNAGVYWSNTGGTAALADTVTGGVNYLEVELVSQ